MAKTAASASPLAPLDIQLTIETVTPEQAKRWLDVDNHRNRAIRDSRVSYLSDEIVSGRWHLTHSGIAFDSRGNLLDGQHRLAAIVKAGVPVPIIIARNVPPESYIAMDRGSIRSIPDVLRSDIKAVAIASMLTRHLQVATYSAGLAPEDVQIVLTAFATEIAQANMLRRLSRPLKRVQLRGALVLRLAQCASGQAELLLRQWRALNETDTANMDQTSAALMRRLLSEPKFVDTTEVMRARLMTLGWQAFDPSQRDRQQFHVDANAQREMTIAGRAILRTRCGRGNAAGSRLERALAASNGP